MKNTTDDPYERMMEDPDVKKAVAELDLLNAQIVKTIEQQATEQVFRALLEQGSNHDC